MAESTLVVSQEEENDLRFIARSGSVWLTQVGTSDTLLSKKLCYTFTAICGRKRVRLSELGYRHLGLL